MDFSFDKYMLETLIAIIFVWSGIITFWFAMSPSKDELEREKTGRPEEIKPKWIP